MALCKLCRSMTVEKLREVEGYQHQPDTCSLYRSAKAGCGLCNLLWRALTAPDYLPRFEWIPLQRPPSALGNSPVIVSLKVTESGDEQLIIICSFPCLIRDCQNHRHVAKLWVYKREDGPVAWHADHACPVASSHPLEGASLEFSRSCLEECVLKHSDCKPIRGPLPKRVVDIGPSDGSLDPYLYLSKGEEIDYIALSYCWGSLPTVKTTLSTLSARRAGMPIDTLPQTYVDAITITRNFGIRYLWIDALCIIQDWPEDWDEHAAVMGPIYRSSYLTISALDSSSSHDGILKMRQPPTHPIFPIKDRTLRGEHEEIYIRDWGYFHRTYPGEFPAGPLSKRAWALQERVLSPRMLHFGKSELIWQCNVALICECQGNLSKTNMRIKDQPAHASTSPQLLQRNKFKRRISDVENPTHASQTWQDTMEDYSKRLLTVSSDKLPAISGLASVFFETRVSIPETSLLDCCGSTQFYLAGHWKMDLQQSLLWTPVARGSETLYVHKPKSGGYRAPSWSWASVDGAIEWRIPKGVNPEPGSFDIRLASCTLAKTDPFGEVKDGLLVVRAKAQQMFYTKKGGLAAHLTVSEEGSYTEPIGHLDAKDEVAVGDRVVAVQIAQFESPGVGGERSSWYMVLRRKMWHDATYGPYRNEIVESLLSEHFANEKFERVGIFDVRGWDKEWFKDAQEQIISII